MLSSPCRLHSRPALPQVAIAAKVNNDPEVGDLLKARRGLGSRWGVKGGATASARVGAVAGVQDAQLTNAACLQGVPSCAGLIPS